MDDRYLEPGFFTRHLFNRAVRRLTRLGVGPYGARELRVRGRTSGEWRTTPVNLLTVDGSRYLVSPRGQTQWVRNIRVAGGGELRLGRRTDAFTVAEVDDAAKPTILREYLRRWAFEVGAFFPGLSKDSSDDDLLAAAPGFPVFAVHGT